MTTQPEYDDGRPPAKKAPRDSFATVTDESTESVRCECCSRPLRAAKSVRLGRGPVCDLRGVA